ncbi:hypothetical protein EHW99_2064 [Erwinia amylovora]|uniref:Uncharacterized protein n=2 Tax=Erwinia amylovora TaxID=552 RepID=A0A831EQH3_ERWAM|nr:hypothetical protein EHX00_2064 [Erwinia amylovora]CBA20468.1 hypothetical protein predicted by Glimmer/Critica [Erwinia amylovora CFBP1430]CCO82161.1 hypothetical protein BN433_1584 [Erwinia amylovora Ea266]CCO89745.1 hypothetical protein BN435_1568 [Erwinia amylovora 01SFR-BO]CCO93496.1 hypothetical protein BN437_1561 [Erwinia amylovora NBRC 12687 = CFBP 1232]
MFKYRISPRAILPANFNMQANTFSYRPVAKSTNEIIRICT